MVAVAAFLRVINALDNIQTSISLIETKSRTRGTSSDDAASNPLLQARHEIEDAELVLHTAGLHPDAVKHLTAARKLIKKAIKRSFFKQSHINDAITELKKARSKLITL